MPGIAAAPDRWEAPAAGETQRARKKERRESLLSGRSVGLGAPGPCEAPAGGMTQRAGGNKKRGGKASSLGRGRVPPPGFRASPEGGTTQRAGENKKERRGGLLSGAGPSADAWV